MSSKAPPCQFHFKPSLESPPALHALHLQDLSHPKTSAYGGSSPQNPFLPQPNSVPSHPVAQSLSCIRLFATPMECSTPGFPVLHYLLEFLQTHIHGVSDAIQPSHPLLPPSPTALNLFQHQGLFQRVGSFSMSWLFASGGWSIAVSASASVLPMNIQD